jgi:hypothetical protein
MLMRKNEFVFTPCAMRFALSCFVALLVALIYPAEAQQLEKTP